MSNKGKSGIRRWAILSGIGIQMGVIIYLFAKGGAWLDGNYNPEGKLYTIIFTLLGVAISLFLVLKQTNELNK
ncbi:MAG: AtpZ/AtpI family protein [Flavobacteriaceae bacterium]|nr:AtpZ/AtpI family protein [Flavobacteriaceae bacterium]